MIVNTGEAMPRNVEATVKYVARCDEPIYSYEFMEPPPGIPATNRVLEPCKVSIFNMRDLAQAPSLDAEGFTIAPFTTKINDIYDPAEVDAVYIPEISAFLKHLLDAREVRVYMPFLRGPEAQRRAPGSITAPAGFAHVDYVNETGPKYFEELLGADAEKYRGCDFSFINVWRPITGPLRDHPLAVCDARTVTAEDLVTSVSIARVGADGMHSDYGDLHEYPIYTPAHSPNHRWYYAADLMPSEVLLFKNYDSRPDVARFVPHCAFADPGMPADSLPRASIEVRSLVIW